VVGSGQPDAAAWASSHGQTLWTWPLLADPGLKAEPPVVPATLRTLDGVPVVLEGYVHHRVGQELQVAATPPGGGPAPTLTTAATVVLAADQPPSQDLRGAWSGTLRLVSDASQWPDLGIVRLTDARPLPRVQVQDDRLILSVELELLAVILLLALCFGRAPAAAALLLLATALPAEDLLATVGSRAITRRQVDAAIPKDLFGPARQQARAQRLEGLVNSAATAEALVGIEPPATAIEAAYTTFLAGPFSGTCGCHVVNSYDDYKVAMLVTDADIREGIRLDLAAQQAVNQAWQSACPDAAAQAKLLAERGPALRRERIHLWQIPFYPKPGESLGTDWTTSETAQRAQAAVARLRAGTPWEQVATEAGCLGSPEHPPGDAGLVGRDDPTTLGIAVGTPPSVAPQTIVDPKPSVGGLVLLRWQDLTDAEILHLLQREVQWATRMDVAKRARAIPVVWTPAGRALRGQ